MSTLRLVVCALLALVVGGCAVRSQPRTAQGVSAGSDDSRYDQAFGASPEAGPGAAAAEAPTGWTAAEAEGALALPCSRAVDAEGEHVACSLPEYDLRIEFEDAPAGQAGRTADAGSRAD